MSAAVSAYFYLKVVVHLYMHKSRTRRSPRPHAATPAESFALCCAALAIVAIGVFPAPLLQLVDFLL